MRIVFFEDDPQPYEELHEQLESQVATTPNAARFVPPPRRPNEPAQSYDMRLRSQIRRFLSSPRVASLAVLDYDLTMYDPLVDRDGVQTVCQQIGVPVCVYTFQPGAATRTEYLLRSRDREISIDVAEQSSRVPQLLISYASGFDQLVANSNLSSTQRMDQFAKSVLKAPAEAALALQRYRWGPKTPVAVVRASRKLDSARKTRIVASTLGYWVVNELLHFAGVLLNATAAASYLDIDDQQFNERAEVRGLFDDAVYRGPFSETGPYWWTCELDRIIATGSPASSTHGTGYDLAQSKLGGISHCRCAEGHEGAGYFCIVSERPVCERHSVRPMALIPLGADRSRIRKREFARLPPWLTL